VAASAQREKEEPSLEEGRSSLRTTFGTKYYAAACLLLILLKWSSRVVLLPPKSLRRSAPEDATYVEQERCYYDL
jgi:hypothetical protein